MALQFIFGPSGSGKSYYIYNEIIQESMENPDRQYLVLVPEQFTMQTQKELVMLHPRKGIMTSTFSALNVWLSGYWRRQGLFPRNFWKRREKVWFCVK